MSTKTWPTLYKRNTNGSINQWQIVVNGDAFYSIEGLKGGALTESKPTKCTPKNVGRANESSPEEQAILEAQAKFQKKLDKGYTENIEKVDTCKTFFSPMLAHSYEDYAAKFKFPCLASRKIDGLRYVARADGGWTRNGKPYMSVPHIQRILEPVFKVHPDWVIDGEIYTEDVPFERVVSLVKRPKPTPQDLIDSEQVCKLYVFDGVIDDPLTAFEHRFAVIKAEITKLTKGDKHIIFVENEAVASHEAMKVVHDKYVSEGWEGIMLRVNGSPYENKRSKNLLKYKDFQDGEFVITAVLEGKGSRAGMAGKIEVRLEKPTTDGKTTCEAGIKGGEEYYKDLWADRERLVGKLARVRYQNYTDKGSLRFPVVQEVDPIDR